MIERQEEDAIGAGSAQITTCDPPSRKAADGQKGMVAKLLFTVGKWEDIYLGRRRLIGSGGAIRESFCQRRCDNETYFRTSRKSRCGSLNVFNPLKRMSPRIRLKDQKMRGHVWHGGSFGADRREEWP
jgi:hypothetical protein